jgi:hypothetical protein
MFLTGILAATNAHGYANISKWEFFDCIAAITHNKLYLFRFRNPAILSFNLTPLYYGE